jgi:MGT family glycosyltransferase
MRRSYLFVTWDGGGNVPPVLGVARRLAARGHAVRVLAEPCLEPAVREAGAGFIPFTRHFTRTTVGSDLMGDWRAKSPIGALKRSFDGVIFGPAGIVAEETQRALAQSPTDVLVADFLMMGALIAAEAARIPRVVLFHMPEYLPGPGRPAAGPGFMPRSDFIGRVRDGLLTSLFHRTLAGYLPAYNGVRRAHGLAPLESGRDLMAEYHRADLRLIQTLEAFDFPIRPAPANVRYVGPVLDDPEWPEPWQDPWREDDPRPLIVASLSTTFQNQKDLLRRIIAALGGLEVRGLVTLGPAMAGAAFDLPPNVAAVASAPHAQVFPRAAAVVTHAGHGTVMRALGAGLPLVCLPMGRDQADNAARVCFHGAGLRLNPTAKAPRIREALERVLRHPRHRHNAQRLGRMIVGEAAADLAVAELERVGLAAGAGNASVETSRPISAKG